MGIIGAALAAAGKSLSQTMDKRLQQMDQMDQDEHRAKLEQQKQIAIFEAQKQIAIDSARQMREEQAARINGAAQGIVQGQVDQTFADHDAALAGKPASGTPLTPEQQKVIQSTAGDAAANKASYKTELMNDPHSYVAAAMRTGDITPEQIAHIVQQQDALKRAEASQAAQFAHSDASQERSLRLQAELQERSIAAAERRAEKREQAFASRPPQGYRWKASGELEAIPGGPVDAKVTPMQQKVSDAKDVISLLDMADVLIDKATSSYGGAAIDQAARVFGKSTEGASAAAQLNALEGMLISKMPKMSGPQSDKDVAMYRQMAGKIGDNTVPADQKKAAAEIIRQINEKYLNDVGADFKAPPQYGKRSDTPNPVNGQGNGTGSLKSPANIGIGVAATSPMQPTGTLTYDPKTGTFH